MRTVFSNEGFYMFSSGMRVTALALLYNAPQLYTGGSVAGAAALCERNVDLAFNWSGV